MEPDDFARIVVLAQGGFVCGLAALEAVNYLLRYRSERWHRLLILSIHRVGFALAVVYMQAVIVGRWESGDPVSWRVGLAQIVYGLALFSLIALLRDDYSDENQAKREQLSDA